MRQDDMNEGRHAHEPVPAAVWAAAGMATALQARDIGAGQAEAGAASPDAAVQAVMGAFDRWAEEDLHYVLRYLCPQHRALRNRLAELRERGGQMVRGRRVLGARAAGRSGRNDVSERIEEIMRSEVGP